MSDFVLFHTHGLGKFDFSSLNKFDLPAVDRIASERSVYLCPTVYLKESNIGLLRDLLMAFSDMREIGQLPRLLGFSIEGPLLGSHGGVPKGSTWYPTVEQWREITSWFSLGLKYIILAPDLFTLTEEVCPKFTFANLLELIYGVGGRVAVGHFSRNSPEESARRLDEVLDYIESLYCPSPYLVLTDHLFNDMPRNFRHAFRNASTRASRSEELIRILGTTWEDNLLPSLLGSVPAALLRAAINNRLTPALNFDGGHVDLLICRRVMDYLGSSRVIAMTDHIEVQMLAGEPLSKDISTNLFYRGDGVLAASAANHEQQFSNMVSIGISSAEIQQLFFQTPLAALNYTPQKR
jgi:hypothetical protein